MTEADRFCEGWDGATLRDMGSLDTVEECVARLATAALDLLRLAPALYIADLPQVRALAEALEGGFDPDSDEALLIRSLIEEEERAAP